MESAAPETAQDIPGRIATLRRQLQAQPGQPERWAELAQLLLAQGQMRDALTAADEALRHRPGHVGALGTRAQAYLLANRFAEAEADYRAVLASGGGSPAMRLNLAQARLHQGAVDEARAIAQDVLARNPRLPEAHFALAMVHETAGALEAAVETAQQALRLRPGEGAWHFRLAGMYLQLLQVQEAQAAYRAGLALLPGAARMHSAHLYAYLYVEAPPAQVFAEHQEWARRHTASLPPPAPHGNGRDPGRVLQVGLVAPTFSAHAGGIMGRGFIEHFDPGQVAVTCYSDVAQSDHVTALYRSRATRWRDVTQLNDAQLAEQVRADGIDILVDRSGHAGNNRMGVFARKPAPVQVSYLEYMNTTGLPAMDYWLSDALATPLSLQPWYAERIWHLERCLGLYSPPPESPLLTPLPALRNGHVTFAVFNNALKIQGRTVRLMARVLQALPTARLHFKYGGWERPGAVARMRQAFLREGIAGERLHFAGRSSRYGYLEAFGETDIGLDTFPNNGFTTTLESLWMGVPVVSLHGETTVSRIGLSFLTAAGHPEWVAADEDAYVAKALALAADLPALAAIRAGLRDEMACSPLRDGPGHARSLEAAFRAMWRRWCAEDASGR